MAVPAGRAALGQREERLAFLDDIGGEDRPGASADVPHRVNRSSRDGQGVTGVERPRRLAFDLILQRPFKDIDDLFTRMSVLDCWRVRVDVYARLNDLTPGDAQILPLQIGAPQSRRELHPPGRGAAVVARAHCDLPGVVSP